MSLPSGPPLRTQPTVREGGSGWLAYAVQKGVGATGDGAFGPRTAEAVRQFQASAGLTRDGVAGPATQRAIADVAIRRAEALGHVPLGLARGIVDSESGRMLAAVNHSVPGGVDCGLTQARVYGAPYAMSALRAAFDPNASALKAVTTIAERAASYRIVAACPFDKWELASGAHNWPWAAEQYARYGRLPNPDRIAGWAPASMQPITYQEWFTFYVRQVTRYVG